MAEQTLEFWQAAAEHTLWQRQPLSWRFPTNDPLDFVGARYIASSHQRMKPTYQLSKRDTCLMVDYGQWDGKQLVGEDGQQVALAMQGWDGDPFHQQQIVSCSWQQTCISPADKIYQDTWKTTLELGTLSNNPKFTAPGLWIHHHRQQPEHQASMFLPVAVYSLLFKDAMHLGLHFQQLLKQHQRQSLPQLLWQPRT